MPFSKRPSKNNDSTSSPLDAKKRALQEQERKVQEQISRKQRLIEDAPRLAREQERRRRDELVSRASRTEGRPSALPTLHDPRHVLRAEDVAVPTRGPRLRRERRRGMLTFFALLFVLAGVFAWIYFTVLHAL